MKLYKLMRIVSIRIYIVKKKIRNTFKSEFTKDKIKELIKSYIVKKTFSFLLDLLLPKIVTFISILYGMVKNIF
jgi:hypothetical protein